MTNEQIAKGAIPGAVVLVGTGREIVYLEAFGKAAAQPAPKGLIVNEIYDLASLSKSIGTATSIMVLVDEGKIDVSQKTSRYLPEFTGKGKEDITVEDLLLHRAGLIADNPMSDYAETPAEAWRAICDLPLRFKPGSGFEYSDVGFIVLGKLVERVSGQSLDVFAQERVFKRLGMTSTSYRPTPADRERTAPTERRNGEWLVGQVHDPRSARLGGVAGHAGVFSSASDVGRWCQMLLRCGKEDGGLLSKATVAEMTRPRSFPDGKGGTAVRALGLDVDTRFSPAPRGDRFPVGTTFGHTGFTGTSYWIDPVHDCFVVILSNRVHPDGKGDAAALRRGVANAVGEAFGLPVQAATTRPATRP